MRESPECQIHADKSDARLSVANRRFNRAILICAVATVLLFLGTVWLLGQFLRAEHESLFTTLVFVLGPLFLAVGLAVAFRIGRHA